MPKGEGRRSFPLVALVVLDGWGCAPRGPGNAVALARTPVFDALWARYPHTTLAASGEAVGLPPGQMGNSEVGHLTIGAGRVVYQDLMRVNRAVAEDTFYENDALRGAFGRARERGSNVHLLGLVSYGGVHSHIDHLRALLELARREGMGERTFVHAFTDGRDVSPVSAKKDLAELSAEGARIVTVAGRYYAMDRDGRWDRTERALATIVGGEGRRGADAVAEVRRSYADDVTDEFIEPIVLPGPRLAAGDAAVFFNFRPDRARQLSEKLVDAGFDLTTMTRYRDDFPCPVAFSEQNVAEAMAEVLADKGVRQLHIAETEKYAHVTYFFNGGTEDEWEGETRILVPSPRDVPTYDQKPEMSAPEVTRCFVDEIGDGYRFAILNFANPDMVGHTGVIPAVVKAVETVDACLGRAVDAVHAHGGVCLVTADHGNAEEMLEADGVSPHTAHTTNPVPLVLTTEDARLGEGGTLADLVPTCLGLLGIAKPGEMSGRDLTA
ncbi:MAG: 2,3-bisphosphoglycerate-independent phosphoglycerate mutase, partial [Actinomycetota bacterium]|nr:2,3-bisphosphoglycerate-independent phosphoglycerate mutase [Actinomycetota bacterium]